MLVSQTKEYNSFVVELSILVCEMNDLKKIYIYIYIAAAAEISPKIEISILFLYCCIFWCLSGCLFIYIWEDCELKCKLANNIYSPFGH